jgi:type II secretory pathway pseudopilin PulG
MNAHSITNQQSKIKNALAPAFTLVETGVAMAIVAVAMLLVAQSGFWSMRERASSAARFAAIEQAANVLEAARATPWESLTAEWAESQRIPDDLADQLPAATLTVKVELDESQPLTKRVIVELRWTMVEGVESQPLRMEGLFSRREMPAAGGTP